MKTVRYIRMPELLDELNIARSNGSLKKLMKAYKKVELKVREGGVVSPARRQLLSALLQALFTMSLYCVKVSLKLRAGAALSPVYAIQYRKITGSYSCRSPQPPTESEK